jgi:hypothetical protein
MAASSYGIANNTSCEALAEARGFVIVAKTVMSKSLDGLTMWQLFPAIHSVVRELVLGKA